VLSASKSMHIAEEIIKEIDQQKLAEGEKLKTEQELAKCYQVSRETIRKAIKHLIEIGRIYSIQGSGHYVRQKGFNMVSTMNQYSSITDLIRNAKLIEGDIEVQIFKRKPTDEEVDLLGIEKSDSVFILDRIRTADGEPIVYSQNILPESIVSKNFPDLFEPGSLSRCLEMKYGIQISEALMEIQAVKEEEKLPYRLKESSSAILKFVQVHYDLKKNPIFISCDFMRNDLIRFFIRRTK
jgi:GntR family transcriptional regulator